MPIPGSATREELVRLLDLFPLAQLREAWSDVEAATKKALCESVAGNRPKPQIASFVDSAFGFCKQHVYLFDRSGTGTATLPSEIPEAAFISGSASTALFLAESVTEVVLVQAEGPPQATQIKFLWPLRIDLIDGFVAVRFVILEKDIQSYFNVQALTRGHGISEEKLLEGIVADMSLVVLDVHAGMKHLWRNKFMDCYFTKYKKSKSSASENMNKGEKKGIRENYPELFQILLKSSMRESLFMIEQQDVGVNRLSIDPSAGRLSFLQYSSKVGAAEDVIKKILAKN